MSNIVWAVLTLGLVSAGLIACGVAVALDVRDMIRDLAAVERWNRREKEGQI
jgi:hypothetical protein